MPRLDRHLFVPRSGGYRLHHLRELRHKVPVLLLRKYLTAPNILTFISGDLDLYSFLVRKKQWKNFGKALLKNEYDKPENIYAVKYPELVEQLESQYMMKLLKPDYCQGFYWGRPCSYDEFRKHFVDVDR